MAGGECGMGDVWWARLPSIRHISITPQIAFFREVFPDMPPDKLNFYFNRFAHIILDPALKEPVILTPSHDSVAVPQAPFDN